MFLTKKQQRRREKGRRDVGVLSHAAAYCISSLMEARGITREIGCPPIMSISLSGSCPTMPRSKSAGEFPVTNRIQKLGDHRIVSN